MRKIFSFLLLVICYASNAQTPGKIAYYYKGKKISFSENYERLVIRLAPGELPAARRHQIAGLLELADSSVKQMADKTMLSARMPVGAAIARAKDKITSLGKQAFIGFVHPVFKSPSGKDMGCGDELVVKLKAGTSVAAFESFVQKSNSSIARKYAFADRTFIISAGAANNYDAPETANRFFESGLFEFAEPDLTLFDGITAAPNDPLYNYQWANQNTGSANQYNGTAGVDMKVQQAWNISKGAGIKVAVIDEGVDLTHPDLQANLLQGFDAISFTSNPGDGKPLSPYNGHGTSCAGIVAAIANNNIGVAGVAPESKIIPINVATADGYFTTYTGLSAAFDYAWQHSADVISNSWGGGSPSQMLDDAILRAVTQGRGGKGCVVLFASGNYDSGLIYPSSNPNVISVGGVSMCGQRKSTNSCDGEYWWGANYGVGLDVVAPCVKIATTDISGTGGYNGASGTDGDYFTTFNGTSSATPNAAGVAALILAANNNLTVAQARNILEGTCGKLPGYSYSANADQPNGSWNTETGYGLVNAYSAVQAASTGNFCNVQITGPAAFCPGTNVTLSVLNPVAGTNYQWRKNGVNLSTGNSIATSTSGSYDVVATQTNGCVAYSQSIVLPEVCNNCSVKISSNILATFCPGTSVTLSVQNPAAGTIYQWRRNGVNLGTGNSIVTTTSGSYDVVATHTSGCIAYSSPIVIPDKCQVLLSNNDPVTTCDALFYDSGGSTGNYGNNESFTKTFFPAIAGKLVQITIDSFDIANGDILYIYDGVGTNGTVLTGMWGSGTTPQTFTSSTGALTVSFTSNVTEISSGFFGKISCYQSSVFRSKKTGAYSDLNTWEVKSGSGYVNATKLPTSSEDSITIRTGHTVTIDRTVQMDQLLVESGAVLRLTDVLGIFDGPGDDLVVNGTLDIGSGKFTKLYTASVRLNGNLIAINEGGYITGKIDVTGTVPQTITLGANVFVDGFNITNPSVNINVQSDIILDQIEINNNGKVNVNGAFTLLVRVLTLNSGRLIIANNGLLNMTSPSQVPTIVGGSATSFIEGPLKLNSNAQGPQTLFFPVGKDVYRPITLQVTAPAGGFSSYQAQVFNTAPASRTLPASLNGVSSNRYVRIVNAGIQAPTAATVTLSYGADDAVASASSLRIAKDNGAGNWVDLGGSGSANDTGFITSTVNFTGFSDFVLATTAAPAPACALNVVPANGATGILSSATLIWNAVANASSYDLYIWAGPNAPGTPINVTNNSYNATGMSWSALYNWYVVPKNANGSATGCSANATSFTTAPAPVGLPACVVNTSPVSGSVLPSQTTARLKWSAATGATSYEVYLAAGTAVPGLLAAVVTEPTYYATNLIPGTTYSWYIAPGNGNGVNTACGAGSKTTFTTAAATGGGNLPPVANAGSDIPITLPVSIVPLDGNGSYDPDGRIVQYYWYQIQGPVTASLSDAFSINPIVTGLTTAGNYLFGLQVKDNSGALSYSQVKIIVSPAGNPGVPTCTSNTSPANGSTIGSPNSVTLTWNAVSNATSYEIYMYAGATPPPTIVSIGTSVTTTYNLINLLAPGTLYNWYVVPKNATGSAIGCATNKTNFTTAISGITGTGLQADYYNGIALAGTPLLTRIDPTVNMLLTYSTVLSPAPGIVPNDTFSIRWSGQVKANYTEAYTFYTLSDDGIRLWVNGVQLVDNWTNQGPTEKSGTINLVAGQKYDIKIEYYENTGESTAKLSWSSASTPKTVVPQAQLFPPFSGDPVPTCTAPVSPANGAILATQTTATLLWSNVLTSTSYDVYIWSGATIPSSPTANIVSATYIATGLLPATTYSWFVVPKNGAGSAVGCSVNKITFTTAPATGTGLQGDYYNGIALAGPALISRVDPTVNMLLTYSTVLSPAPGIVPNDAFSIRWTGQVKANYTETYTFYTLSDDGIRLWVNGVQLVDNWTNQGPTEKSGTINLVAGQKYDIRIEYYENTGESTAKLSWSSASTAKAVVPQANLYPPAASTAIRTTTAASLINAGGATTFTSALRPNPVKSGQEARLQINTAKAGTAIIHVVSSDGHIVSSRKISVVPGQNTSGISTSALTQGLYIISIDGIDKPVKLKLLVIN